MSASLLLPLLPLLLSAALPARAEPRFSVNECTYQSKGIVGDEPKVFMEDLPSYQESTSFTISPDGLGSAVSGIKVVACSKAPRPPHVVAHVSQPLLQLRRADHATDTVSVRAEVYYQPVVAGAYSLPDDD